MKIKCIKAFKDKTTAKNIKDQTLIKVGDILVCNDELAKDRIKKGLVVEIIEEADMTEVEEVEETSKPKRGRKK